MSQNIVCIKYFNKKCFKIGLKLENHTNPWNNVLQLTETQEVTIWSPYCIQNSESYWSNLLNL